MHSKEFAFRLAFIKCTSLIVCHSWQDVQENSTKTATTESIKAPPTTCVPVFLEPSTHKKESLVGEKNTNRFVFLLKLSRMCSCPHTTDKNMPRQEVQQRANDCLLEKKSVRFSPLCQARIFRTPKSSFPVWYDAEDYQRFRSEERRVGKEC